MAAATEIQVRIEIARLSHRFGFGPSPGEYASLLAGGLVEARRKLLVSPTTDLALSQFTNPPLSDVGPQPAPNTPARIEYATELRRQRSALLFWWLDRMVLAYHGLQERMTWFWHGHWATSMQKVDDPLPMYRQNQTLRLYCLGNFSDLSQEMVNDDALIYWLDGQRNLITAPNENFARELMELFTLGVDRYSEDDIKAISKALTGYRVKKTSGDVTFLPKQHHRLPISFLGTIGSFDATSLSNFLVKRDDCATFIAERLWYRFISSSRDLPNDQKITSSFSERKISDALIALGTHPEMGNLANSQVKSPTEWFVSVARAFLITPSMAKNMGQIAGYLEKLGQVPFYPPSVGGWPADESWISTASAQYRIAFAGILVKQADLSPLTSLAPSARVQGAADWLGVAQWSDHTQVALNGAINDPERLALLAICSPEYVVNS